MPTMTMRKKDWTCVILHTKTMHTRNQHAEIFSAERPLFDAQPIGLRLRYVTGSCERREDVIRALERVL